jgi:hypothetical protein
MNWGPGLAPSLTIDTINTSPSGGTAVTADAILAAEFLESTISDRGVPVESLSGGSAITGVAMLRLEFRISVLRCWGAGATASMIRHYSRPALSRRVRRLFFPGRLGTFAVENEAMRRSDAGAPIEAVGTAGTSVTGDSMLPIEMLSYQRSDSEATNENTANLQVDLDALADALAASVQDGSGPVEWLASRTTMIEDVMGPLEWVGAAPEVLVSLESGPERIRLLATRGRVRLLRRN